MRKTKVLINGQPLGKVLMDADTSPVEVKSWQVEGHTGIMGEMELPNDLISPEMEKIIFSGERSTKCSGNQIQGIIRIL